MKESSILEKLGQRCVNTCDKKGWEKDWKEGGAYLFLESAEFIEALRGKGEPVSEAADVLFVFWLYYQNIIYVLNRL